MGLSQRGMCPPGNPNTTTELLAEWIGERLLEALESRLQWKPEALRVGVDENHGQWGYCEFS